MSQPQTLYKLTDSDSYTRRKHHNCCKWGENITHKGKGKTPELCSPQVIHAYTDPLLAVLFNYCHSNLKNPQLWEAQGTVVADDHGMMVGCYSLKTIKQITIPDFPLSARVRMNLNMYGRYVGSDRWRRWWKQWLNGEYRDSRSIHNIVEYIIDKPNVFSDLYHPAIRATRNAKLLAETDFNCSLEVDSLAFRVAEGIGLDSVFKFKSEISYGSREPRIINLAELAATAIREETELNQNKAEL